MIASGYELTTAITNFIIFLVSAFSYLNTKEKNWRLFFLLMTVDAFIGTIVHGINMSITFHNILWILLVITFVFTINSFLNIFINLKTKYYISLSIGLILVLLILFYLKRNFLLAFTIYVLIVMIITISHIIRNSNKSKYYLLLGYIFQIIGGILLLSKIKIPYLDFNGIYHLFMALTIFCFYIGIKKRD